MINGLQIFYKDRGTIYNKTKTRQQNVIGITLIANYDLYHMYNI